MQELQKQEGEDDEDGGGGGGEEVEIMGDRIEGGEPAAKARDMEENMEPNQNQGGETINGKGGGNKKFTKKRNILKYNKKTKKKKQKN